MVQSFLSCGLMQARNIKYFFDGKICFVNRYGTNLICYAIPLRTTIPRIGRKSLRKIFREFFCSLLKLKLNRKISLRPESYASNVVGRGVVGKTRRSIFVVLAHLTLYHVTIYFRQYKYLQCLLIKPNLTLNKIIL